MFPIKKKTPEVTSDVHSHDRTDAHQWEQCTAKLLLGEKKGPGIVSVGELVTDPKVPSAMMTAASHILAFSLRNRNFVFALFDYVVCGSPSTHRDVIVNGTFVFCRHL